jgi:predicted nucleic acid-binding protein
MPLQPLDLEAIPVGALIAIDTAPLIYWLEDHARWGEAYAGLFEGIAADRWQGLLSTVSLAEILTGPLQQQREELVERYIAVLTDPASFQMASLSPAIAIGAARLRARYALRLPDAVQLSTALQRGAMALVTHDRDFAGCGDLPILSAQA